jgi:hypothetical protein
VLAAVTGLALVLLTAVPGILAADLLAAEMPAIQRRVLGLCAGFACFLIAAYLATLAGAPFVCLLLLGAVTIVLWILRRNGKRPEPSEASASSLVMAVLAIALTFVWFAVPLLRRAIPDGWDAAFHVPILEMFRTQGHLPDTWAPYEPAFRFNYPSGLHAALAIYGRLSGLPSERVFTVGFAYVGLLALLMVWALGTRFGPSGSAGTLAVLVYGFTDGWGTLSGHALWGGLPSLAGLTLMSAAVLAASAPSRGAFWIVATCIAATLLTHHLSFLLLGCFVGLLVALEFITERRLSAPGLCLLSALAIVSVTMGLLVWLNPTGHYSVKEGFRYDYEGMVDMGVLIKSMHWPMVVLGTLGLIAVLITNRSAAQRLLPAWAVALIMFWVSWDIVYRSGVHFLTHENYTAFTPSRGLTDAAVPLAVSAGVLLSRLVDLVPWPNRGTAIVATALLGLGWHDELSRYEDAGNHSAPFESARLLCAEVKAKTPEGSVIFAPDFGEAGIWLPYLCSREFNYFPKPGYERFEYREQKMRTRDPREFVRIVHEQWGARPVFQATRAGTSIGPLVARAGGWNLYQLAQ